MSLLVALVIALTGIVVGVLSALFGVGGGLVMVPFMTLVLDKGQHVAEGTSLLVIVPTAVAGVIAHHRQHYVSFKHAALLAAGGVGGGYVGAELALALSGDTLKDVFGVFLVVMGTRMAYGGWRTYRKERAARAELI